MGASAMQDDPLLRLRYLKDTGQDAEATSYAKYLQDTGQVSASDPLTQLHKDYASGALQRRTANANEADAAEVPSTGVAALNAISQAPETVAAGVPGGKLLISAGRKLTGDTRPFADIQREVNTETSDVPYASAIGRAAGTLATTPFLPASGMKAGAVLGGLDQALNNDPNSSLLGRVVRGGLGAAGGAAIGGLADAAISGGRALFSPTLGKQALARKAQIEATDAANYGQAAVEGGTVGTTPAIQRALAEPDIKPFADVIRGSRSFAGADDATVLREAYKLMSEQSTKKGQTLFNANDFKAGTSLAKRDIDLAKAQLRGAATQPSQVTLQGFTGTGIAPQTAQSPPPSLREALSNFLSRSGAVATRGEGTVGQQSARQALERHGAESVVSPSLAGAPSPPSITVPSVAVDVPPAMPSFPYAVAEHARMAGERDAMRAGADATKRALAGAQVAGRKLETNSPEAFIASLQQMTPAEAKAAVGGILGRIKQNIGPSIHPLTGFGLMPSANALLRSPEMLRSADAAAGNTIPNTFQKSLLSLINGGTNP